MKFPDWRCQSSGLQVSEALRRGEKANGVATRGWDDGHAEIEGVLYGERGRGVEVAGWNLDGDLDHAFFHLCRPGSGGSREKTGGDVVGGKDFLAINADYYEVFTETFLQVNGEGPERHGIHAIGLYAHPGTKSLLFCCLRACSAIPAEV